MVSDTTILDVLKRDGPCQTAALAKRFDVSLQGMRQRLAQLKDRGLIADRRPVAGKGRPAALWSLTAAGHAAFPDSHAELTVGLIGAVRRLYGEEGIDKLIDLQSAAQAERYRAALSGSKDLGEAVERLAGARSQEGYMAEVRAAGDGSYLLIEHHCPICAAAAACQGFCRAELQLFRDLFAGQARVTRTQHLQSGDLRCAYAIAPLLS